MKTLLLLAAVFYFTFGFSQEIWGYLPIEISNNYHGAIFPTDENVVHVVSDNGIFYKTEDGGETWSQFDSGVTEYFFDLVFDGPDKGYAVGDSGKILKTSNAGETWSELSSGTSEALISVAINAQNSIWTVGDNGTVLHSTDGGNSWVLNNSLTIERLNSVKFKNENIGYIAGDNGVLLFTDNGGVDWEVLTVPTSDDLFSISITQNYLYILNGNSDGSYGSFYYEAYQGLKTTNNQDWIQFYIEDPLGLGCSDMYFLTDNTGFAIGSAALLCDCCNVWIVKTFYGGQYWNFSLDEETNTANCHANSGYADIKFVNQGIGFVLLGSNILKTPYETAGVEEFNKDDALTIYPNPTSNGKFNLKINLTDTEELSFAIFDVAGKKIYSENDLKENNIISIPNISEGIYFVNLMKNGKIISVRKLLKGI